jgi:shikimate dehydrogenase
MPRAFGALRHGGFDSTGKITADLLVNATPMGMWPRVDGSIWLDGAPILAYLTVFDLVYNPLETRLMRKA